MNQLNVLVWGGVKHNDELLCAFHSSPTTEEKVTLMWGYVQKRARREKLCPQYRVSGPLTSRSHYSGAQWSYLNRDPTWWASWRPCEHLARPREFHASRLTQHLHNSPLLFMTRIWTHGIAT